MRAIERKAARRGGGPAEARFGLVGLGRTGVGLALQACEKGVREVGFDPAGLAAELREAGVIEARRLEEFKKELSAPRAVFLYIPAGPTVDALLEDLAGPLEPGDVIVDGGNSYWRVEGGYVHAGPPGSGHFVKLVHNGIEFGMLQAIGGGVDPLERYRDQLDIPAVLSYWRHGSVIRGWLVDRMHEAYVKEGGRLERIPSFVADALRMESPIPLISQR